jgi:hypothetical protein
LNTAKAAGFGGFLFVDLFAGGGFPPGHSMLHCNRQYAAMQTNGLLLASGIPKLSPERSCQLYQNKGTTMSKTASFGFVPSPSLFGRFLAVVDGFLMAHARATVRNGDLPYFGL